MTLFWCSVFNTGTLKVVIPKPTKTPNMSLYFDIEEGTMESPLSPEETAAWTYWFARMMETSEMEMEIAVEIAELIRARMANPPALPLPHRLQPLDQETVCALLTAAVATEAECSITMSPIVASSECAATPCKHVFNTVAIQHWLATNSTCPMCRSACSVASIAVGFTVSACGEKCACEERVVKSSEVYYEEVD